MQTSIFDFIDKQEDTEEPLIPFEELTFKKDWERYFDMIQDMTTGKYNEVVVKWIEAGICTHDPVCYYRELEATCS